jgi:6-pyruvoyltetrahydropterin/6-carboxytetrahydropterin synthase
MSLHSYSISIRKEAFKFSSAHMTVFADGTKEALHGHNYTTEISLDLKDISLKKMISFSFFKKAIKEICDEWDEKVLLPENCPFLKIISKTETEIEFLLCQMRYVLPREEVILLPLDNITVETLSKEFCLKFLQKLSEPTVADSLLAIKVRVDESPGQGATYTWSPPTGI